MRPNPIRLALSMLPLTGCGEFSLNPFEDEALRVPGIEILTPSKEGERADALYTISVAFTSVTVVDTWNLYYVSDATPSKGALIGQDLPVTARTLEWDTSAMPAGTYYLYGELSSLDTIVASTAPGSIIIDHPGENNTSPSVTLTSPNGGESFAPGDSVTVSWSASDADGDALTFALEVSADDGNTWSELVDSLTGTSYTWTIPDDQPLGIAYRLRVTATDDDDATKVDISNAPFSIVAL